MSDETRSGVRAYPMTGDVGRLREPAEVIPTDALDSLEMTPVADRWSGRFDDDLFAWVASHPDVSQFTFGHNCPTRWAVRMTAHGRIEVRDRQGEGAVVEPPIALLWAACVEAQAEVDVGTCPKCEGAKGEQVYGFTAFVAQMIPGGWATPQRPDGSREGWAPCSACQVGDEPPTGRDIRQCARLVLDATPRQLGPLEFYSDRPVKFGVVQAAPGSREALHVAADRAQLAGDPLGEWIALGLERWMAGHTEGLDGLVAWLRERTSARTGEL